MTLQGSRPGGFGAGDRRAQRAVEDLERLRLRQRRMARKLEALPATATLAEVIAAVNQMRKVLADQ